MENEGQGEFYVKFGGRNGGGDYFLVLDKKMVICGVGYFEKIEDNRILVIT